MLFILGALVVEAGTQRESRRDAQNAADAGALAAVAVLGRDGTRAAAVREAAVYGVANNFPPGRTVANDFKLGAPRGSRAAGNGSALDQLRGVQAQRSGRLVSGSSCDSSGGDTWVLRGGQGTHTRIGTRIHRTWRPNEPSRGLRSIHHLHRHVALEQELNAVGDIHSNNDMAVGTGTVVGEGTYRGTVTSPRNTIWTPTADNPTDVGGDEDTPRAFAKTYDIDDFRVGRSLEIRPELPPPHRDRNDRQHLAERHNPPLSGRRRTPAPASTTPKATSR